MVKKKAKKENFFLNITVNIILPVLILTRFSKPEYLGAVKGLILALSFPIVYGVLGLIKNKKVEFLPLIGVISILLTGTLGLLKLNAEWIAVKEAGVPFIIGLVVILSLKTPFPLIKKFLLNENLINKDLVEQKLKENNTQEIFETKIVKYTYLFSISFFVSSILNFSLAKILLKATPGTVEFNNQLGKMTALSFPVIALPSTVIMVIVLYFLVKKLSEYTTLKFEEIFKIK